MWSGDFTPNDSQVIWFLFFTTGYCSLAKKEKFLNRIFFYLLIFLRKKRSSQYQQDQALR
jgi:hypothetical protein